MGNPGWLRSTANIALDFFTVCVFAGALFFLARPGSSARSMIDSYQQNKRAVGAAKRNWSQIQSVASILGDGRSPATVIEVSDYLCPFCRAASTVVDSAAKLGVRVVYLSLPSPARQGSMGAAQAALCGEAAGSFRQLHAQLMSSSQWQLDTNWVREADLAGVRDLRGFEACLTTEAVRHRLDGQRAVAESLRIRGTPTFVSQRGVHLGVPTLAKLLDLAGLE